MKQLNRLTVEADFIYTIIGLFSRTGPSKFITLSFYFAKGKLIPKKPSALIFDRRNPFGTKPESIKEDYKTVLSLVLENNEKLGNPFWINTVSPKDNSSIKPKITIELKEIYADKLENIYGLMKMAGFKII